MSFLHFDAVSAASAAGGLVNLESMSCSDSGAFGAYAEITFYSYGQTWCQENTFGSTFLYNWIDPVDATPGSPVYQLKRNLGSGTEQPSGPGADVWTNVTAFLGFGWSVANGGINYSISDTIEWVGGTHATPVQATVSAVSGGAITALTFTHTGDYGLLPTDPIASSTLTGSGSGATFNGNAAFDHRCIWAIGAGYDENEYWDGIISIRKGTGPVLDTATISIEADAS